MYPNVLKGFLPWKLVANGTAHRRSSYILASWVSTGGLVNTSASEPRAGCVKFYLRQNVCVAGEYKTFLLAYVMWYQNHPNKDYFGQPLQVCCKDLFVKIGPSNFPSCPEDSIEICAGISES